MASSRKPKRAEKASADLAPRVAATLESFVARGSRLVVGLSGGVDSMALLDILARLRKRFGYTLEALHVNHGLSANAAQWSRFCRSACSELEVRCRVVKVTVARGNSVERAARDARYTAFATAKADFIVLAHNADDQAETVLLQLLRGSGVRGLAAMPRARSLHASSGETAPMLLRPLLDVPRTEIEAYAAKRRLAWIEDESNLDRTFLRNWIRHELTPRIAEKVPGHRATLTRAARNFAEAAALLDELAQIDSGDALESGALRVADLRRLSHARAKNVLRYAVRAGGWPAPQSERLDEALRQVLSGRADASPHVDLGGCDLRRHRGVLHLVARTAAAPPAGAITWQGEPELSLPHLGGVLTMSQRRGAGLSAAQLAREIVTIRARAGGERLQPDPARPTRTVKNLLQEAGVPPWERARLPYIYAGETLVCIPGVASDHRFRARRGEASVLPRWRPLDAGARSPSDR